MHFYTFHPAKHKLETYQLKPLERLAYRELMDIYYDSEQPLTTNIDDLAWRMGYETDELRQALKLVLDKFFVIKKLKGDTEPMYHHPRLDYEIKAYQSSEKKKGTKGTRKVQAGTSSTTSQLQDTTSESTSQTTNKNPTDIKKSNLIQALRNQGVKANTRMSVGELQALFDEHCKQTTNEVQDTTNEVQDTTSPVLAGKTINQEPITNNQEPNNISPLTPQGAGVDMAGNHETTEKTTQKTKSSSDTNKTASKSKHTTEVDEVFEFWITTFAKDRKKTKLSDIRKRKVIQRLEQGYTVQDIKTAIVGCSKSDYHIKNEYTDLELICRDEQHIDRFLGIAKKSEQPKQSQFGGANDPLAVNQHWADYRPPDNWEENARIAIARTKAPQQNAPMGMIDF